MILRLGFGFLALILVASTCLAQGGGGFGGMGGMGGGMGGMGGMFQPGVSGPQVVHRTAVFEAEGGRTLTGTIQLTPVLVNTDLGQYQIRPDRVKSIRYLKPAAANAGEPPPPTGKVITTSGQEVSGTIMIAHWMLDLDFGTLQLDASKVKSVTFNPPVDQARDETSKAGSATHRSPKISPIQGPNVAALMIEGPRITRIAASDGIAGEWVTLNLKTPFEGRAVPVVGAGVAVYTLGSTVYAFSGKVKRWDVLELPSGVPAFPTVGAGTVSVRLGNQVHEFTAASGKWKHVDFGVILKDADQVERKPEDKAAKS